MDWYCRRALSEATTPAADRSVEFSVRPLQHDLESCDSQETISMLQGLLQLDRYLGFDLVSAACGLAGLYLLGNKNRYGFLLCMAASAFGIVFGALAQSLPLLLLHLTLLFVNLRGFQKWQLRLA
jgi:hypothetical protein